MDKRTSSICVAAFASIACVAQSRITGTVKDEADKPLEFASISIEEMGVVAQSDAQGAFIIAGARPGPQHLRAALVGYATLDTLIDLVPDNAITLRLRSQDHALREVEVRALRAGERSPYAQNTLTHEQLQKINTGVDMPLLLDGLPSVVTTTDAGTGFGYTGLRIRGSDATRINVTINGVPLNDAESQAVYWVDLPDLATSTEDVEVQRGVGSSTNGPGAFGASINVRTTEVKNEANASVSVFGGSYGTQRYTACLGTGLIKDKFSFDGRISSIKSDGYIDRASAKLNSYFLQGAWIGKRSAMRLVTFSGKEVTYQAWNGVPRDTVPVHRTYNEFTYANQVDDYRQTHYQLLFDQRIGANTDLNITLFHVVGKGYYEEYKTDQSITDYGIQLSQPSDSSIVDHAPTDVIRRRWLDNVLTGANIALRHRFGRHELVVGGNAMRYDGQHFGEVLWAGLYTMPDYPHRYYDDDARKDEANAFAKLTYALGHRIDLFGDAQVRRVRYDYEGFGDDLSIERQRADITFFNPKLGMLWRPGHGQQINLSFAVGNKEPGRDDFASSIGKRPNSETLYDGELGYERRDARSLIAINIYHMNYSDQLISTGKLNDVGLYERTNVASSYRQGIELQARVQLTSRLIIGGNATFSRNKVRGFKEYVDDYDNGGQRTISHGETDIAFSPNVIAGGEVTYRLWNNEQHGNASIAWITKYVGKQFLDNTSSDVRALDHYFVNDLRTNVSLTGMKGAKSIDFNLTVRNIFGELYSSNGWSYSYISGGQQSSDVGLFPQALINVLGGVTVKF